MSKNNCKKCDNIALHTGTKGNNIVSYGDNHWITWPGKDELEAFENFQKSKLSKTSCNIPLSEVATVRLPKQIARISLCGAVSFTIDDTMTWKKPTDEQIKNLHDLFCIDVEVL